MTLTVMERRKMSILQDARKGKLRDDVTQQIAVVKRFIRERQAEREVEVQLVRDRRSDLQDQIFKIDTEVSQAQMRTRCFSTQFDEGGTERHR